MSATALQMASVYATVANGGVRVAPRLIDAKIDPNGTEHVTPTDPGRRVIQPQTAQTLTRMLEAVVSKDGTAPSAAIPGYRVGGKTGTAEKVVNGRYSGDKRFNAFLAAFPMDDPQYIVLTIIDEPKPEKPGMGATAGLNAAPILANIIRRSGALLGVKPEFGHESGATVVSYQ